MTIDIHIARSGATPGYLFIHGLFGSAADWNELIGALPAGREVFALNLPGHGGAEPLDPSITTFDDCIEALARAVRERVRGPVIGVGYSLGGRILLGLWRKAPELFRELCLVSTFPGFESDADRKARAVVDKKWAESLEQLPTEEFFSRWYAQGLFARDGWSAELAERVRVSRLGVRAADIVPIFSATSAAQMPGFWETLSHTSTPVRYVVGARDLKYREIAQALQTRNPAISVSVLDGSGHMVPLEQPLRLAKMLQ